MENLDFPLPQIVFGDMPVELSISRRMSVRTFNGTSVPISALSNVLWAGYGYSNAFERTVPSLGGVYPLIIYVSNETATYRYVPEENSLAFWKAGDLRGYGQHLSASIQLFIVLNLTVFPDIYLGSAEAGFVGQNIYLEANSLGLGTVVCGGIDRDVIHNGLNLPQDQYVLFNMPLGYPATPYRFSHVDPPEPSNLPEVQEGSIVLEEALSKRRLIHHWREIPVTYQKFSQVLWSTYGYSYLYDDVNGRQHRVVPSALGSYPMKIYAANQSGAYEYFPVNHSVAERISGDVRYDIADASRNKNWVATAPLILVILWDSTILNNRMFAEFERGAMIQNVQLESAALELSSDWVDNVDEHAIRDILGLSQQTNLHPTSVVAVGHPMDLEAFPYAFINESGNLQASFIFGQSREHGPCHGAWTQDVAGGTLVASTLGRESLYGLPDVLIDVDASTFDQTQVTGITTSGNLIIIGGGDVNLVSRYYGFLEVDGEYAMPVVDIFNQEGWTVGFYSRHSGTSYYKQGYYGQSTPVTDYGLATLYLDGDCYVLFVAGITGRTTMGMCGILANYQDYDLSGRAMIYQFFDGNGDGTYEEINEVESIP